MTITLMKNQFLGTFLASLTLAVSAQAAVVAERDDGLPRFGGHALSGVLVLAQHHAVDGRTHPGFREHRFGFGELRFRAGQAGLGPCEFGFRPCAILGPPSLS